MWIDFGRLCDNLFADTAGVRTHPYRLRSPTHPHFHTQSAGVRRKSYSFGWKKTFSSFSPKHTNTARTGKTQRLCRALLCVREIPKNTLYAALQTNPKSQGVSHAVLWMTTCKSDFAFGRHFLGNRYVCVCVWWGIRSSKTLDLLPASVVQWSRLTQIWHKNTFGSPSNRFFVCFPFRPNTRKHSESTCCWTGRTVGFYILYALYPVVFGPHQEMPQWRQWFRCALHMLLVIIYSRRFGQKDGYMAWHHGMYRVHCSLRQLLLELCTMAGWCVYVCLIMGVPSLSPHSQLKCRQNRIYKVYDECDQRDLFVRSRDEM